MLPVKDTEWQVELKTKTKTKKKQRACLQETHFRAKDTHRMKVRRWKKIFQANENDKEMGVAIVI